LDKNSGEITDVSKLLMKIFDFSSQRRRITGLHVIFLVLYIYITIVIRTELI
jgi:hypothetical protein